MKIVKVNKSRKVGKRGSKGTTDMRPYHSKMMVDLDKRDMSSIYGYNELEDHKDEFGCSVLEKVDGLRVEEELTDYLNQKLNGQISYKYQSDDWDVERHFGDKELVVYRIVNNGRTNDVIDMKEHLGIDDELSTKV